MQTRTAQPAMPHKNAWRFFAAVALALALSSTRVHGAPPGADSADQKAHTVARQALNAYKTGQYENAIAGYKKAYDLLPVPRYLYAIGMSYYKLGWLGLALEYFQRFMGVSQAPAEAPLKQRATKRIAEIQRISSPVKLDVTPTGARVLVAGQPPMTSPIPNRVRLRNGWHWLTVSLAGYDTTAFRFQVGPGLANSVSVQLKPRHKTETPTPARHTTPAGHTTPSRPAPRPEVTTRAALPRARPRPRLGGGSKPATSRSAKPKSRPFRSWGWAMVGLAGASLVTAGVLGGLSLAAKKSVDEAAAGTPWEPDLKKNYNNVTRYGMGAWVASGLGAALLVSGAVLLLLDRTRHSRDEQSTRRTWITPVVGRGQVGINLGLRL